MIYPLLIFSGFILFFVLIFLFFVHQSLIASHIKENYPSLWQKWVNETGVTSLLHYGGWYYKNGLYWEMFNFQIGDHKALADRKLSRMILRSWIVLITALVIWFPLIIGIMIVTS